MSDGHLCIHAVVIMLLALATPILVMHLHAASSSRNEVRVLQTSVVLK